MLKEIVYAFYIKKTKLFNFGVIKKKNVYCII